MKQMLKGKKMASASQGVFVVGSLLFLAKIRNAWVIQWCLQGLGILKFILHVFVLKNVLYTL